MAPKILKGQIGKAVSPDHDGRHTEQSILKKLNNILAGIKMPKTPVMPQMPRMPKMPY
jgi:hypothetical protein